MPRAQGVLSFFKFEFLDPFPICHIPHTLPSFGFPVDLFVFLHIWSLVLHSWLTDSQRTAFGIHSSSPPPLLAERGDAGWIPSTLVLDFF